MKTKTIRLLPTLVELDVIVCSDLNLVAEQMQKQYKGQSAEYYFGEITPNMTCWICASDDDGDTDRLLIILSDLEPSVVAHEAVHVTWKLAARTGKLFSKKVQEPQCYMVQQIVHEIMKMADE